MQVPFVAREVFKKPMEREIKVHDFLPVFIQMSKSFLHSEACDDGRWV